MEDKKSIYVDFSVSSSLYKLKIEDLSQWGVSANKPAVIEITPPGYDDPYFVQTFNKESTIYDSNCLELSCGDECEDLTELPDGVWKITLKASPSTFSKTAYYLKLDKYRRRLDLAFIKSLDSDCRGCNKKQLLEFMFYEREMEALVRSGDRRRAQQRYLGALADMDSLINCKEC